MRMIDAKKEIEDKLFQGAPLSLDAMMCALVAMNAYIEQNAETSSIALEINVPDEEQELVKKKATEKLMDELQKGIDSSELGGYVSGEEVRRALCYCEEDYIDG